MTVIDGATNQIITTVTAGDYPDALCYNPQNNKVYCENHLSDNVTVIDGGTNQVLRTIGVGDGPLDFTWNPAQNRVYVANYYGSSISVLRDSMTGIEEDPKPQALSRKLTVTVIRSLPAGAVAYDAMGRRALNPKPGVYFVREESQAAGLKPQAVRKVVVTR